MSWVEEELDWCILACEYDSLNETLDHLESISMAARLDACYAFRSAFCGIENSVGCFSRQKKQELC